MYITENTSVYQNFVKLPYQNDKCISWFNTPDNNKMLHYVA